MGGKDNLDFPQFVTAIARIAEEIVLKESLVATMSERLHYLCTHLETIVESKKNWRKLQKFTQRLGMVNSLIGGVKNGEGGKEMEKKQNQEHGKSKGKQQQQQQQHLHHKHKHKHHHKRK